MTTAAIGDQLTAQFRHARTPDREDAVSLADAIKTDLAAAGYSGPGVDAILGHHLGLANIAAHVAHEMAALTASPLYPLHSLPEGTQGAVARIGMIAADELIPLPRQRWHRCPSKRRSRSDP